MAGCGLCSEKKRKVFGFVTPFGMLSEMKPLDYLISDI